MVSSLAPKSPSDGPSPSIPLPRTHISRTSSEIRFDNDKQLYEWRHGIMYHRLVNGMLQRSMECGHHSKIDKSLKNIIKTHASPIESSVIDTERNNGASGSSASEGGWLFGDLDSHTQVSPESSPQEGELAWCLETATSCGIMLTQTCPSFKVHVEDGSAVDHDLIFDMDP